MSAYLRRWRVPVVVLGVALAVVAELSGATVGLLFVCGCGAAVALCARALGVDSRWPLLAFVVPVAAGSVDTVVSFLPVFPDAGLYRGLGAAIARGWENGTLLVETGEHPRVVSYATIIALVYAVFGQVPLFVVVVNATLWGVAVAYWLGIVRTLFPRDAVHTVGIALSFYPAAVLYVSATLREALVMLPFSIACYHLVHLFGEETGRARHLVVGGLATAALVVLRPELVPSIVAASGATLVVAFWGRRLLLYAVPLLAVVPGVWTLSNSSSVSNLLFPVELWLLEFKRKANAARPRAYLEGLGYSTWIDIALYLPVRTFYLLFSPFPWQPGSYEQFAVAIDALFVLCIVGVLVVAATRGVFEWFDRRHLFVLTTSAVILAGYALTVSTTNAAPRRRLYALPLLTLLAVGAITRVVQIRDGDWTLVGPEET